MKKNPKYLSPNSAGKNPKKKPDKLLIALICVAALLLLLLIVMLILMPKGKQEVVETTVTTTAATTAATTEETTVPTETSEPVVMLPEMAELYEQNPDTIGYIRIDGTKLDYPVMFTPDDQEKYIHMNFKGNYEYVGLPFINVNCGFEPETMNQIIYGHNMRAGTGFAAIMKYENEDFWKKNPTIYFSTLYEEREYEVVAAFYDKVYKKTDTNFKFYKFFDPQTEEEYNEGITYFKEHAEYDTGITPEFGDKLITLVTCAYHTENGRFVVVARQVTEEDPAPAAE